MILENQHGEMVYSDGFETEKNMLEIAKNYPEDLSQAYIAKDSRYTINNTFSLVRHNILNWYQFKKDAVVCEIGAGMGSLTGLLCDKNKHVTAVEMNEQRANVIRARYANRENLDVVCADINHWRPEKKYDYIIMVGVLEYAAIFTDDKDPFFVFLKKVTSFLKEDGVLLFAIENRFGLRYWSGAAEDHLQIPFVGLEGYKEPNTARTFSKNELIKLLEKCHLKSRFYYVFPDYKFPTLICTDAYKPSYEEFDKISFTYGRNSALCFNEKDLYKDILDNNKLDFFANSYLVEASFHDLNEKYITYVSARGECKPEYKILTTIDSDNIILKKPCTNIALKHIDTIDLNTQYLKSCGINILPYERCENSLKCDFYYGEKADKVFAQALESNDLKLVYHLIDELKYAIEKSSEVVTDENNILKEAGLFNSAYCYGPILAKGFIDMTFYNAFYENETLIFYDQEWCFDNVPLKFILYYAVKLAYNRANVKTNIKFTELLEYLSIRDEKRSYDVLEEYIWSKVMLRGGDIYGEDGYCNLYNSEQSYVNQKIALDKEIEFSRNEIIRLNNHIENLSAWGQGLDAENITLKEERTNSLAVIAELEEKISAKTLQVTQLVDNAVESKKAKADLQEKLTAIEKEFNNKLGHIELLLESERQLQRQVQELQTEVANKQGHIELLLESDRKLEQIYQSTGWKVLTKCYKVRDSLIPQGSKRRFVLKLAKKFIKKPGVYLRKLNWANIKKLRYYASAEGMDNLSNRLDAFDEKHNAVQAEPIAVQQVEVQEHYESLLFPKVENPTVSIIIPVYNQFHYTYACLKSILENTQDVSYEVIIADDVSIDDTVRIKEIVQNITVVRNEKNLRFLLNCNNAAKYARGKYIHFLNNDTQVQEKWLSSLVQLIESDETIGMVGSKLVYPDGRLQEAGGILWRDGSAWNYGNGADPSAPEYNYVKEADYISGASIMISKNLWEQLGGFDEHFAPAYCEDSDLAFTVREAGYKVMYQPLSVVVHFEGVSNGTDLNSGLKAYQLENSKKFYTKWKDVLEAEHYPNAESVFTARDKSKDKKCVLIVDHYVPHFDKDAGSKTVYQYIKLFCESGYNVKFIGDNFYRHEPYTTALEQLGVEVLVGNYYANHWKDWVKANAEHIDFAFLNRPHIAVNYIDFIRKNTNAKIIYYGHDLHFLREMREYELTGNEDLKRSSESWKQKELELMRAADLAYYPSEVEVAEVHKIDASIAVRAIPAYIYETVNEWTFSAAKRKDLMFIGGFGHRPNVDAVVWFYENVWPIVKQQNKDMKMHILGSNPPDEIKRLHQNDFIIEGFVTDEQLAQFYQDCKISIVPLRYGAGIKGKVVEAMHYQMPIITTSVGAEGIDDTGEVLCIADDAEIFAQKIIELYNDELLLAQYSKNALKHVNAHFTAEAAGKLLAMDF